MQLFAAWAAVAAVVGVTAAVAPTSEVRQQVALVLAQTLSGTEVMGGHNYQVQDGMLIADECTDAEWYSECSTVVQKRLCNKHVIYGQTCCRSCTLAGHLQAYGPHLDGNVQVKPSVELSLEKTLFEPGSEVRIVCQSEGFPEPEVAWFLDEVMLVPSHNISIEYSRPENILTGKMTTILVIKNFNDTRFCSYYCVAANALGIESGFKTIGLKSATKLEVLHMPEVSIKSNVKTLRASCQGQASEKVKMAWYVYYGNRDSRVYGKDEVWQEGDVWKVKSELSTSFSGNPSIKIRCLVIKDDYTPVKAMKTFPVYTSDKPTPTCSDTWEGMKCYWNIERCHCNPVVRSACCNSCTLYSNATMTGNDIPVELVMTAPRGQNKYGESLTLECRGRWYPTVPEVTWYKDGSQLASDGKYFISDESFDSEEDKMAERVSRLTVSELKLTDLGQYTCTAASPTATVSKQAQITFRVSRKVFRLEGLDEDEEVNPC